MLIISLLSQVIGSTSNPLTPPASPKGTQHATLISPGGPNHTKSKTTSSQDNDDEYVYDVFYFALKDVNDVNELLAKEAANIGTM